MDIMGNKKIITTTHESSKFNYLTFLFSKLFKICFNLYIILYFYITFKCNVFTNYDYWNHYYSNKQLNYEIKKIKFYYLITTMTKGSTNKIKRKQFLYKKN